MRLEKGREDVHLRLNSVARRTNYLDYPSPPTSGNTSTQQYKNDQVQEEDLVVKKRTKRTRLSPGDGPDEGAATAAKPAGASAHAPSTPTGSARKRWLVRGP